MAYPETIFFTNDLDGVHFRAPMPFKTARMLYKRKELVPVSRELQIQEELTGAASLWNRIFYSRPFTSESGLLLEMIRAAASTHERNLKIAALSGRGVDLHELTREKLEKRYPGVFDHFYLNQSDSASGWKEHIARRIVENGNTVVHIDDDLRPALRIARIDEEYEDPKTLVYLVRNLSNRQWLLDRGGVTLPENLVLVPSLREAGIDFTRRLRLHKI